MPRDTKFQPYSLAKEGLLTKRTFVVDNFKGVDLSSSLFDIADNEAVDLDNIEYDKKLRRTASRKGYEEIMLGKKTDVDLSGNLNGKFFYDGKLFLHIGESLFKVGDVGKSFEIKETKLEEVEGISLNDHISYGFLSNYNSIERLFIIDGESYKVLEKVEDTYTIQDVSDIATIPTTTTAIPCEEANLSSAGTPLDDVNMLTPFRYNKFITPIKEVIDNETPTIFTFNCDTTCDTDLLKIEIEIEGVEYQDNEEIIKSERIELLWNSVNNLWANIQENVVARNINGFLRIEFRKRYFTENNIYNTSSSDTNMIVKIKHETDDYKKINGCTFGKIFNDRLFLSGNPNYPNTDWHSSGDLNDFSYFSDLDYCNYGTRETSIVGYDIYSSGILIVFKESSSIEPTVYTRTYEEGVARDYAGNRIKDEEGSSYTEDYYKLETVNSMGGLGALSNRSIANFLGDTIVLTRDGLKALRSVENVADNERIFVDVSTKINSVLTKEENLKEAIIYTFNDRLFLKTPNYLFVGEYNLRDENNQYSWFKWSGLKPIYFFDYDDELYFSNGSDLCKFPFDRELTKDYVSADASSNLGSVYITGKTEDNSTTFTVSNNYIDEVKSASTIGLSTPVYIKIGETSPTDTEHEEIADGTIFKFDKITLDKDYLSKYLKENAEILVEIIATTSPVPSTVTKGKLVISENDDNYFYLVDEDNVILDISPSEEQSLFQPMFNFFTKVDRLTSLNFEMIDETEENDFKIIDYTNDEDEKEYMLLYSFDEDNETIQELSNEGEDITIYFISESNIKSFYFTKPINFGTTMYEKTIYSFTIVNDSQIASYMDVGYLASNKYSDYSMIKPVKTIDTGSRNLEFEEFTFGKVQFLDDKLPHIYIRPKKIPRVSYISFVFRNDTESRMLIGQFQMLYTITKMARGVK